jgi:transposase
MTRRDKVELFEQIRREYEFGVGTIAGVARKFGVHRRMVRQAIKNAIPPSRKMPQRSSPVLDPVRDFIDQILIEDQKAPRKQRHTAHRIYARLRDEFSDHPIAERTVREYVQFWKLAHGKGRGEIFVPQAYDPGIQAQVDWYEAVVELAGVHVKLQFFSLRSMWSGAAFHQAYLHATQQAFLAAHQEAFRYFGGVFHQLRYDNLTSAVKKVLRGRRREETDRFIAFRSHWEFDASFCTPGKGHEKGGVEGEAGFFRRNHLVPVPQASSLAALNESLLEGCRKDFSRIIGEREKTAGEMFKLEQPHLLPLQSEDFELAEEYFRKVNNQGCVQAGTNFYSTPLRAGLEARVRVLPSAVEIHHPGRMVAEHPRCYGQHKQILDLEHYLDVLERKPGAMAGSKPLRQWREDGRWSVAYDQFWSALQSRHGESEGTRMMIELLQLGRQCGYDRLRAALEEAIRIGSSDAAVVRYLITAREINCAPAPLDPGEIKRSEFSTRPLPALAAYDQLLSPSAQPFVKGVTQ